MEENLPLLSIVIPCYNDAQYIEQSVLSALNQTYTNKEVIVVDDGSDATTKAILKKLEPTITKLITQKNQGQSTARNVGIQAAKGEYILVLDSDDFFEATFSEKAMAVFFKNEKVKIVSCQSNLLFEDGTVQIYNPIGGDILNFMYSNSALGTSMFKKEDWIACGGYDEDMRKGFEDWEFFIRILKRGGTAEVIQEPLYNYRKRDGSTTNTANQIKYQLLNYIYIKHRSLYISHFDAFTNHLFSLIESEENQKIKNTQRLEFLIGSKLLMPLRKIKRIFNKLR